jgi:hypothetical protein
MENIRKMAVNRTISVSITDQAVPAMPQNRGKYHPEPRAKAAEQKYEMRYERLNP